MWGISWVPWGCSVPWGDIMSTVGNTVCSVPWYHDARGGISWVPWRVFSTQLLFEYPTVLNTPMVLMISPHMHHDIPPWYSNFKGWYPPRYSWWYPPTCIMISPTVLNIPHGTQDNPPRYSWYPPTVLNTPTVLKISPTVLNTPMVLKISPTVLMISPHGTEHPPRYWTPPRYCTHIIQGGEGVVLRKVFWHHLEFMSTISLNFGVHTRNWPRIDLQPSEFNFEFYFCRFGGRGVLLSSSKESKYQVFISSSNTKEANIKCIER